MKKIDLGIQHLDTVYKAIWREGKRVQGDRRGQTLNFTIGQRHPGDSAPKYENLSWKSFYIFEVLSFNTLLFVAQVNGFPLPLYELVCRLTTRKLGDHYEIYVPQTTP